VIIERTLFQVPDSTTMTMCTTKKSTMRLATMKWIERADWRPPKSSTSQGKIASRLGDMVMPVSTISGSSTSTTPR